MDFLKWSEIRRTLSMTTEGIITTGYFAKLNAYVRKGYTPVSICGKAPAFYLERDGLEYKRLAPHWSFYKPWKDGTMTDDDYVLHYYDEVLAGLDADDLRGDLMCLAQSNRVVLLCYEKPFDFCHRHIVSSWMSACGDYTVQELQTS